MAAKRANRRKKRVLVNCCHCGSRLWRCQSDRHHLFVAGVEQMQQKLGLSRKNALLYAAQNSAWVDRSRWMEQFFCPEHGHVWLLVSRDENGTTTATYPPRDVWAQTTGTFDPDHPNPTVGEYTRRMSQGTHLALMHRYGS
ncbi:hypothetical protein [Leptolyngbya sp. FACHB-261]|uniref:hypothetical protein n=1 Tax=Leptolyngbya sp. FACHB-261 TaxID=2692806 RepID=UPI0016850CC1|nr:hypothetical protein [Leptolyngbya sp. FACHB-261]MBD2103397.1 hypothetical protein [Leptolyngbya sp. FACHB-261]